MWSVAYVSFHELRGSAGQHSGRSAAACAIVKFLREPALRALTSPRVVALLNFPVPRGTLARDRGYHFAGNHGCHAIIAMRVRLDNRVHGHE